MSENEVYSLAFTIAGQNYNIKTSVDREKMLEIIKLADKRVSELVGNRLTINQALVLAMLQFAEECSDEKQNAEKYRDTIGEYLKDAEDAKLKCELLTRENERLKKRLMGKM